MCYFWKKILLKDLNYWNVELQEAYFSPLEVKQRIQQLKKFNYFHLLCVQIHSLGFLDIRLSRTSFNFFDNSTLSL